MNIIEIAAFVSLTASLTLLTISDVRKRSVSIASLVILFLLSVALGIAGKRGIGQMLVGAIPGLVTVILAVITKGKIGLGDALVFVAIGIWCGIKMILSVFFVALFLCSVVGVTLILMKKASRKTALPFIPFILAGYVICELTSRLAG